MPDFTHIDTRIRVTTEQLEAFRKALAADVRPRDPEDDVHIDLVIRNASVEALREQASDLREQLARLWAIKEAAQTALHGCHKGPGGAPCAHCEIGAHRILLMADR